MWYKNTPIKFEIVKAMREREIGFMRIKEDGTLMSRGYKIHTVSYFDYFIEKIGILNKPTNIYASVAKVKNIPTFTLNLKRRAGTMEDFNTRFDEYVTDYDLMIDLDPEEQQPLNNDLIQQAIEVSNLLDEFKITYSIRVSGKGIHLYIEGKEFQNINVFEKPKHYKEITTYLKNIMGFHYVDDSLYTDDRICRRYCKVPFTIDVKTMNACIPITKQELLHFDKEQYKAINVLKNRNLYKHGIPLHNIDKQSRTREFYQYIMPD